MQGGLPNPTAATLLLLLAPLASGRGYLTRLEIKQSLVSLGAVSDRGQFASPAELAAATAQISRLEGFPSDAADATLLEGSWDLVFTDVRARKQKKSNLGNTRD